MFLTGQYGALAELCPFLLNNVGGADMLLARLGPELSVDWLTRIAGPADDSGVQGGA